MNPFFIVKVGGGAVFNDDLNFRGKLWMKMKVDSCLVLRMARRGS
jgi:hypothetical protein